MIKITKTAANRIDMEFNASSIDEETMRAAIEELIEKSDGIEHGHLLYRLHHFPWPSLGAMAVKLEHLPELFKLLGKFDRCAVLSDAGTSERFKGAGALTALHAMAVATGFPSTIVLLVMGVGLCKGLR